MRELEDLDRSASSATDFLDTLTSIEVEEMRKELADIKQDLFDCHRIIAAMVTAMGGEFTIPVKHLREVPHDVTMIQENQIDGAITFKVEHARR